MYCVNRPNIAVTTEVGAADVPNLWLWPEIEEVCAVTVVPRRPLQISLNSSSLCTPSLPSDISNEPQDKVHRNSVDDASSSKESVSLDMLVQDGLPAIALQHGDSADDINMVLILFHRLLHMNLS